MPTVITAGVLQGGDFETFAMNCLRYTWATIHMREEPLDAPYRPYQTSDHLPKALEEAKAMLVELEALTPEERIAKALLAYKEKRAFLRKVIKRRKDDRAKLEAMLQQVEAFVPPTFDHESFKQLMVKQLRLTMETDGDTSYCEWELKGLKKPVSSADGDAWFEAQRTCIQNNIAYHTEEWRKMLEHGQKANAWVQQAVKAIKATAKGKKVSA